MKCACNDCGSMRHARDRCPWRVVDKVFGYVITGVQVLCCLPLFALCFLLEGAVRFGDH